MGYSEHDLLFVRSLQSEALSAVIRSERPCVVFIDTLGRFCSTAVLLRPLPDANCIPAKCKECEITQHRECKTSKQRHPTP
jgi:hypothetical protein